MSKKISFLNKNNQELKGDIYLPMHGQPKAFALFAHCFTCSKNLKTVSYIAERLAQQGFGVLGFDFTGLGDSEGDFSETNFSHNLSDLEDASSYLSKHYQSPKLLIGHSLGGTACLYVANQIESAVGIVTIGSPNEPEHVTHLLESSLEEIEKNGESKVDIGGRKFNIKKQFLEDLKKQSEANVVKNLNKSLLIFHSPQDKIVTIKNAEELYKNAKHPKSFVSLDGASHLLTNQEDATYVGEVIAGWSKRYLEIEENNDTKNSEKLEAKIYKEDQFTTQIKINNHLLIADEPKEVGGDDLGPSPVDLVDAGLASCTLMTLKMYAKRKDWQLGNVEIKMTKTSEGSGKNKQHQIKRELKFGNKELNEEQLDKLVQIADKCPVHRMLTEQKVFIETSIKL
ncbi:MAG: bifunctional alpha/beta hydrolase/OsmC family protein [Flavobacteriaceae bacterium]|nr:bifunctional alpha/beta hydrolase/OsmC family protein [Flavobacteriaceae bacterium]